jgi:HprK-related kinase A
MSLQFSGPARDIRIGPFRVRVRTPVPALRSELETLYADFPNTDPCGGFADFHVTLGRVARLQSWLRPRVVFEHDGIEPFRSMRADEALLLFEGGLNWTIAENANFFLVIHAAAIERDNRVAILPAPSGAGKSTLCAALVSHGWRLMSDELTLISLDDGMVTALARPISLKNEAIEAIAAIAPGSVFSTPILNTEKGTVAFLKPPAASVGRMSEPAPPAWIVEPRYTPQAGPRLARRGKADTFMALYDNTYNYHLFGQAGFEALAGLVDRCDCYSFAYSRLDDAVEAFTTLSTNSAEGAPESLPGRETDALLPGCISG